ncbi:MAG: hypothetical protein PHV37_09520 [Candidatus Gastranaerophilales bacterium]|nr:hypothetical protein [Candidatus Gastranaerophilales bacterium]
MLNKKDILDLLNDDNNYVDKFILDAFIKNWKIEAIYEDENGVEFFDEAAVEKIKMTLSPKNEEQPIYTIEEKAQTIVNDCPVVDKSIEENIEVEHTAHENVSQSADDKEKPQPVETPVEKAVVPNIPVAKTVPELKNLTVDMTNQTLNMLAETIAKKVSVDISNMLKNNEWLEELVNADSFKKDNTVLAQKINELIHDNKVLVKKIQDMKKENESYLNLFGNIYIKKK